MNKNLYWYTSLSKQLTNRATRAFLGLKGFRNEALHTYLNEQFSMDPGSPNAFLSDPVFEATFGWKQATESLADLDGELLNTQLLCHLDNPFKLHDSDEVKYRFPLDLHPYDHQLKAWRFLADKQVNRSVLVSSGTGSGKTECFLIPILNDLANEVDQQKGAPLTGVRALFLYPLNALIKSQKDRLVAWSEPFEGKVKFCLYNGETPKNRIGRTKDDYLSEVRDRPTLRESPPPILVTNNTMLEYMLIRSVDQPIISQSQGTLRWIVIDEAHTYLGSQAAELTLLLRRVLHAFGCKPGDVRFVATSATLGDGSKGSKAELEQFLADIAGVPTDQVEVIIGERSIPSLPKNLSSQEESRPELSVLETLTSAERFDALAKDPVIRKLRMQLANEAMTLSSITAQLHKKDAIANNQNACLELLDICTQANKRYEKSDEVTPLLPLRGHFFQRTISGLWACVNHQCKGRSDTYLDDKDWPFGSVFLEQRKHCSHCDFPVFEMVQCDECGAEYLSAEEKYAEEKPWLTPYEYLLSEDEFQQELESSEDIENEDEEMDQQPIGLRRLLTGRSLALRKDLYITKENELINDEGQGAAIHLLDDISSCPICCVDKNSNRTERFTPIRAGAPFLLSAAIPTLLESVPERKKRNEFLPFDGRRLITFTDSRQGTARIASKLQQNSERDFVRSMVYHNIVAASISGDDEEERKRKLDKEIEELKPLALGSPEVIQPLLNEKIDERRTLDIPKLGRIPWGEMSTKLMSEVFNKWLLPDCKQLTFEQFSRNQDYAELCLLREFFVRTKRQASLESLGLVQLQYPELEKSKPSMVFKQRGVSDEEWSQLLHVTVDHVIRSGGPAIKGTREMVRWLGFPGRTMYILQSSSPRKSAKFQRYWPTSKFKHNRIVKLLSYAFNLDLSRYEHLDIVDEMLMDLWRSISKIFEKDESGYYLDLSKKADLVQVSKAWLCPVTRRLLPQTFRGITPYLSLVKEAEHLAKCKLVEMPIHPCPFPLLHPDFPLGEWLESNVQINHLRDLGVWTDLNDRIAAFSPYWRSSEHSAQISGHDLTSREKKFNKGEINLLSCSTTMEMGVDIDQLSAIAMNNVPPHPANFLQRAGRAGRRGETAVASFTLCKSTPHGEAVFKNTLWPFTTRLVSPKVALKSEPIVQRHIHSLLLTYFLKSCSDSPEHLSSGWFFEQADNTEKSPSYMLFINWCRTEAQREQKLLDGVESIAKRTVLQGRKADYLLNRASEHMEQVALKWREGVSFLLEQLEAIKTAKGDSKPEQALDIQLKRIRNEYLISELANVSFLPGYGFPTGVVPLITTTSEELARAKKSKKGFPSRHLASAIRDYAPGTDTVLDGRVYRSQGITLNWHIPADAGAENELQLFQYMWRCGVCGDNGIHQMRPTECPVCGNEDQNKINSRKVIQPAGFAVNLRYEVNNNTTTPQYIPIYDPIISLGDAEWVALPLAHFGRYRSSPQGHINFYSDGLHQRGYSICMVCGWADAMVADGEDSTRHESFKGTNNEGHRRLRGGKANGQELVCPGNFEGWKIQDNLRLSVTEQTDVFELQLWQKNGKGLDQEVAYTLVIGLRNALCSRLGIEQAEIGTSVAEMRGTEAETTYSMFLYDTSSGGAGYAIQAASLFSLLLKDLVKHTLVCPKSCEGACQACLLTYETQHFSEKLNRQLALEYLNTGVLHAFELPEELKVFGEDTHPEPDPIPLAFLREYLRNDIQEVRFYFNGNSEDWEPLDWRMRSELSKLVGAGVAIQFIIPLKLLEALTNSQRGELAALTLFSEASLYTVPSIDRDEKIMLTMGGDGFSIRWAANTVEALAPCSSWGSAGNDKSLFVYKSSPAHGLSTMPKSWKQIDVDSLIVSDPDAINLDIKTELNIKSTRFGETAWTLVENFIPQLSEQLNSDKPLVSITYSDRYVKSPLSLMLLGRLLSSLKNYTGGADHNTQLNILTSKLEGRNTPRNISHDWKVEVERKKVAEACFSDFELLKWSYRDKRTVPHARELRLVWSDTEWRVRLDQGVGYWVVDDNANLNFPFDQSPTRQAKKLLNEDWPIKNGDMRHPTHWFFVKVK